MYAIKCPFTTFLPSEIIQGMGRAGHALKTVLETYEISQNKLATLLGVRRSVVFRWFHEQRDPTAETVSEIVKALNSVNPKAAQEFVTLYLGELINPEDLED